MRTLVRLLLIAPGMLLSAWANGQTLDFDSVCPAPPCAIGTLYAASGVNFVPNTHQIVAPGTNGLTGPNGGRYLSIATFPYQLTITLARQATFFALRMSRASTSSGPITVAVTWLKAGVVVGTTNIALTTVDVWSTASASVAGGFDSIFIDPSGGADLTFGIDSIMFGGTCFGFADVSPSDSFCNATEWLGNRNVTLGCAPGMYCPASDVTRAQMALFMNRLGNALIPRRLHVDFFGGVLNLPATTVGVQTCVTAAYVPRVPESAQATGTFAGIATSDGKFRLYHVFSTDNGASWNLMTFVAPIENVANGQWASLSTSSNVINLVPGTAYLFATSVDGDGAPISVNNHACKTDVLVTDRVTTSAPFDPRPLPALNANR